MTQILPDIRRWQTYAAGAHQSATAYLNAIAATPEYELNWRLEEFASTWQERSADAYRKIEILREDYDRQCAGDAIALRNAMAFA